MKMTCRSLVEILSDYLSAELSPAQRNASEEHIRECPGCERYLTGFAATVALAKSCFDDPAAPLPVGVPPEIVAAILNACRRG